VLLLPSVWRLFFDYRLSHLMTRSLPWVTRKKFSTLTCISLIIAHTLSNWLTILARIRHHQLGNLITTFVVTPDFLILLRWKHIHNTFTIFITDCISFITYLTFRELLVRLIILLTKILIINSRLHRYRQKPYRLTSVAPLWSPPVSFNRLSNSLRRVKLHTPYTIW
jgi:hypothetical protein